MNNLSQYIQEKLHLNKDIDVHMTKTEIINIIEDIIEQKLKEKLHLSLSDARIITGSNNSVTSAEDADYLGFYFKGANKENRDIYEYFYSILKDALKDYYKDIKIEEHNTQAGAYKIRIYLDEKY
ncbi:MAG: hypothetical protein IJH39_11750 [Clostridia bacterium]|nr:hypothetical protein [Clostridia bacterium]